MASGIKADQALIARTVRDCIEDGQAVPWPTHEVSASSSEPDWLSAYFVRDSFLAGQYHADDQIVSGVRADCDPEAAEHE